MASSPSRSCSSVLTAASAMRAGGLVVDGLLAWGRQQATRGWRDAEGQAAGGRRQHAVLPHRSYCQLNELEAFYEDANKSNKVAIELHVAPDESTCRSLVNPVTIGIGELKMNG